MQTLREEICFSFLLLSIFFTIGAVASPQIRRVPLVTISLEGYAPFPARRGYLDAAVQEQGGACTLVDSRGDSRIHNKPWSPLDFYSNIVGEANQRSAGNDLGESDIYFAGDDHNRNGGTADASWTASVPNYLLDSIDFEDPRRTSNMLTFRLGFTRGNLSYHTLVGIRASLAGSDCTAKAYVCAQSDGGSGCSAGGWTKQLTQVIAVADTAGGLSDRFRRIRRERDRHDISALDGMITDAFGTHRENLVRK